MVKKHIKEYPIDRFYLYVINFIEKYGNHIEFFNRFPKYDKEKERLIIKGEKIEDSPTIPIKLQKTLYTKIICDEINKCIIDINEFCGDNFDENQYDISLSDFIKELDEEEDNNYSINKKYHKITKHYQKSKNASLELYYNNDFLLEYIKSCIQHNDKINKNNHISNFKKIISDLNEFFNNLINYIAEKCAKKIIVTYMINKNKPVKSITSKLIQTIIYEYLYIC